MLITYSAVRSAARNWQDFSSDAPFRVPIPSEENARSIRQLPIETDPPQHTNYRTLIEPFFRRPTQPGYVSAIDDIIRSHTKMCAKKPQFDVVREFALPIQSYALALMLGVPAKESEAWVRWGTHVFYDSERPENQAIDLEAYLTETIEVAKNSSDPGNFFTALNRFRIDGCLLTKEEKLGIANLVFAGGRDTVINMIAFLISHFAKYPPALVAAARSEKAVNLAVEESIRVVTPLTHIGRVCKTASTAAQLGIQSGDVVSLCWAAANYDPDVFSEPEQIDLERSPNPHVGFGSGHHACLGAAQARAILRSLIRNLSRLNARIRVIDAQSKREQFGAIERDVGFERLIVSFELID